MALTNREKHKRWRERHPEKYRQKSEIRNAIDRQRSNATTGRCYAVELIDPNDGETKAVFVANHKDKPLWKKLLKLKPDTAIRQWLEATAPVARPVDGFGVAMPQVAAERNVARRVKELKGKLLFPEQKRAKRPDSHKQSRPRKKIQRISGYRPGGRSD